MNHPAHPPAQPIPVNLLTGFLGVGKTTALRSLLEQHERACTAHPTQSPARPWAVLINEFGEIGVDGLLVERAGVVVRDVPGGCLCCTSSALFSITLQRLLHTHPGRILIEPTGLGHPLEILRELQQPEYRRWLDVRATLTLFDPRHLASMRHREHPVWQDQIFAADVLVANKLDLASEDDVAAARSFIELQDPPKARGALVQSGQVDIGWLDLPVSTGRLALTPEAHAWRRDQAAHHHPHEHGHDHQHGHEHRHEHEHRRTNDIQPILETHDTTHHAYDWWLDSDRTWSHDQLDAWLASVPAFDRVKGVVATDEGWTAFNRAGADRPSFERLPPHQDSSAARRGRVEILHHQPIADVEQWRERLENVRCNV